MKLIVWLWNPWEQYKNTRHNVGFYYLDLFANKYNLAFKEKYNGLYVKTIINDEDEHFAKEDEVFSTWVRYIQESIDNPEVPENMHTHQIRHSACTHWYQDNINLAEISTYLGHESIETTRVYLGISKEELEQALSKRESIDVPTTSKYKNIKGGLRSLLRKKTL